MWRNGQRQIRIVAIIVGLWSLVATMAWAQQFYVIAQGICGSGTGQFWFNGVPYPPTCLQTGQFWFNGAPIVGPLQ
jgi:hypothetical protein